MEKLVYRNEDSIKKVWDDSHSEKISSLMNTKYRTLLEDETFQIESGYNDQQIQNKSYARAKR